MPVRLEVRFGTEPSGVKAAAHFDTGRDVIAESEWHRYSVGLAALAPGIHSVSVLVRLDAGVPLGADVEMSWPQLSMGYEPAAYQPSPYAVSSVASRPMQALQLGPIGVSTHHGTPPAPSAYPLGSRIAVVSEAGPAAWLVRAGGQQMESSAPQGA